MYGYDLAIYLQAAWALLSGQSPYAVPGFFSPAPFALLLVPLAWLPFPLAYALWTAGKLALSARLVNRRQFILAIAFLPAGFELLQGQVDLLVYVMVTRGGWLGAVLATLRPQLAIWALPWLALTWIRARRWSEFARASGGVLALWGLMTVIDPGWLRAWFAAPSVAWVYNRQSASLYGLAQVIPAPQWAVFAGVSLVAVILFAWLRPRTAPEYWRLVALVNPIAHIYSLCVLYDQVDLVAVILSPVCLILAGVTGTNAWWALVPAWLIVKARTSPLA